MSMKSKSVSSASPASTHVQHTRAEAPITREDVLIREAPRGQAAFERVKSQIEAIAPDRVKSLTAEPTQVFSTVVAAAPVIQTLRARIVRELPTVDIHSIDQLEDYALAFSYVQGRYLAASTPPEPLGPLLDRLSTQRNSAFIAADALVDAELFPAERVAAIREGRGTRDAASDGIALASLFEARAEAIAGKTAFTPERVATLRGLGERVLTVLGWREQAPIEVPLALNQRDRAFTLVDNAYSLARRVVGFLRAAEGDAEKFAPSYHNNGGGRPRTPDVAPGADTTTPVHPTEPGAQGSSAGPSAATPTRPLAMAPDGEPGLIGR